MGFSNPSLFSGTLIYGLGAISQRLISFLLLPFYTHLLSPKDYGIISLLGLLTISMGAIFSMGTGNSAGILYFSKNISASKSEVIWSTFLLLLINGTVLTFIIILFSEDINAVLVGAKHASNLIRYAVVSLLLATIKEPFYMYLRYNNNAKKYVVLAICETLITVLFSIILVLILKRGVIGFFEAALLSSSFSLLLVMLFVSSTIPFKINFNLFKPLVKIGFPSIFGLFAFLVIDYGDRKLIEYYLGIDVTGIYSIGYNFGMIFIFLVSAFGMAWPQYFLSFKNKIQEAEATFGNILRLYVIIFGLFVFIFFWWAKPLVYIMTDPMFHDSYTVIGIIAASYMLKGCYLIFLPAFYYNNKLIIQSSIEWIAAVVNILTAIFLIPLYGMVGAALATFIGYLTLTLLAFGISRFFLTVIYPWKSIFLNIGLLIVLICVAVLLTKHIDYKTTILISLPFIVTYIYIIYKFLLYSTERYLIIDFLRKIAHRNLK